METHEKRIANAFASQVSKLQEKIDFCRGAGFDTTSFEKIIKTSKQSFTNIMSGLKYRNLWNEV